MTTLIELVHSPTKGQLGAQPGLFPIGDGRHIPADWQPKPEQYEPAALPTPFARAEATRLVLGQAENVGSHPLLLQVKWLVLGIAAGVLRLEVLDLGDHAQYENLGQALLQIDPEARYLARLLWPEAAGEQLFGATYRSCLAWGHARRQPPEWDALAAAVSPRQEQALGLLADWREALRRSRRWDPAVVAWQHGLDVTIGSAAPSADLALLREHAALVGPVTLEVATGDPSAPVRIEPVYLPQHAPGRARGFRAALLGELRRGQDAIELANRRGAVVARISLPQTGADADPVALGMGSLALVAEPELQGHGDPCVAELGAALAPLESALGQHGRATAPKAVQAGLGLYPDALRLFSDVVLAAPPPDRIHTSRAASLLMRIGGVDESGIDGATIQTAAGKVVLVDRVGEHAVLDLRALGLVLFQVFTGEAELARPTGPTPGRDVVVPRPACTAPLFPAAGPLLRTDGRHPVEPAPHVYELVGSAPPEALGRRLATLQRFVATYGRGVAGSDMLARAARSFAAWARGAEVAALGRAAARSIILHCGAGVELALGQDALGGT